MAAGGPPEVTRRRAGIRVPEDFARDAEATWDGAAPFGDLGTEWQNDLTLQPETVAPRRAGPTVPTIVRRTSKSLVPTPPEPVAEDVTDEAPALTEEAPAATEELTATEESVLDRGLTEEAEYAMPPDTGSHSTRPTVGEEHIVRHEAAVHSVSYGAGEEEAIVDLPTSAFAPVTLRRPRGDDGLGEALITAARWMMAAAIAMFLVVLAWSVLR